MKVLIVDTPELAALRVTEIIIETVRKTSNVVLGLATGGTVLPLYHRLVEAFREGRVSFAAATTFNLDEYIGLAPSHPCSYRHYMQKELFDHIDIERSRTHLPRGDSEDPMAEALNYEELIKRHGGIDLQLLGIGNNGHIGFNEPTSSLSSRTRIKTLTEETRHANQRYFDSFEKMPRYALTMGIGTILEARNCLLMATGTGKSEAIEKTIEGPVTAACPASALQLHPSVTMVLDREAASRLKLIDYYHHVHPAGGPSEFCTT